jgi:threonylcarbamoyladenosine tRNA methylthiotransferase MtaB
MPGGIDPSIAKERFNQMNAAAHECARAFRQGFVGKTLKVLVESKRDKVSGMLTGYTDNYIDVLFSGPDSIMGRIVSITIKSVDGDNTIGIYNGK